jgi:ERCC4-type nuclease
MSNKLIIIIDAREHKLYEDIIARDLDTYNDKIEIIKENIELGDIHIVYNDIFFIFERKTTGDLQSSIQDGRYKEQKTRMLANYTQKQISYIIEGDDVLSSKTYNKSRMLQGAYLHTMFRDNIRVLYTKNTNETATLILTISTKIIDNPQYFINNGEQDTDYTSCIKLKKKKIENIDENTCYIMQLSQIPYISNVIAKNIASTYPNMVSLIDTLKDYDNKNKELCKIEGVGKEKANFIIKYLFNDK